MESFAYMIHSEMDTLIEQRRVAAGFQCDVV